MKNVLVVYKKSAYDLGMNSKDKKTQTYLKNNKKRYDEIKISWKNHKKSFDSVIETLNKNNISTTIVYRADLTTNDFKNKDYIITIGGDGTLIEVAHKSGGSIPILGINSNPSSSVGFYCIANKDTFPEILQSIENMKITRFPTLRVSLDDKLLKEPVLNEVYLEHRKGPGRLFYDISINHKKKERWSSDALLIGASGGSTAWIYNLGGDVMDIDDKKMQYQEVGKRISKHGYADHISIISHTRKGRLYLDGEHIKHNFTFGSKIEITQDGSVPIIGDFKEKKDRYRV